MLVFGEVVSKSYFTWTESLNLLMLDFKVKGGGLAVVFGCMQSG